MFSSPTHPQTLRMVSKSLVLNRRMVLPVLIFTSIHNLTDLEIRLNVCQNPLWFSYSISLSHVVARFFRSLCLLIRRTFARESSFGKIRLLYFRMPKLLVVLYAFPFKPLLLPFQRTKPRCQSGALGEKTSSESFTLTLLKVTTNLMWLMQRWRAAEKTMCRLFVYWRIFEGNI